MSSQKPHMLILEELHLLVADPARMDIGGPILSTLFATGAKRNIVLVLSNNLMGNLPPAILGNLSCRIITRLTDPKCIWAAQHSTGLKPEQAAKLSELPERTVLVQYAGHPSPFLVRVDELSFPPRPDEAALDQAAQTFLSQAKWSEDTLAAAPQAAEVAPAMPSDALTGDELKVFLRIAEHAELIPERCDALEMDRGQELQARKRLTAKGLVAQLETMVGKWQLFQVTTKGKDWAKQHGVKMSQRVFKSGPVHEFILERVEKSDRRLNSRFRFQRRSEIARELGLQPDSVLLLPDARRIVIEVCCNNLPYDARNLTKERQIAGVDGIIAVTPNQRVREALQRALDKCRPEIPNAPLALVVILDAGQFLDRDFDWREVLALPPATQTKG